MTVYCQNDEEQEEAQVDKTMMTEGEEEPEENGA